MSRRHAEIVGGGLAGLSAAIALAKCGWSVTLHERHASLRREGFGITVHANGLRVLAALGAREGATRDGVQLGFSELRDASNEVITRTKLDARAFRLSRFRLIAALADRAKAAGVELYLGSSAAAATQDGTVVFEDGSRRSADLVVAADGVNSPLRNSLGLTRSQTLLPDGAQRMTIVRHGDDQVLAAADTVVEWWSGTRRIIYGACSPHEIYVALSCRSDDIRAKQVPVDLETWTGSFPKLAGLFRRIHHDADPTMTLWVPFSQIKLKRWSAGRVAVIGDAAHAMPPNLGQGGSCAMMGGLSLAVHLEKAADLPLALQGWEAQERPLIEHTQRWSRPYSILAAWPRAVSGPALSLLALPSFKRQYRRTASHIPTGTIGDDDVRRS
jgi:2-polyprenyl-6-methoxyphenol hydroxylase-like FAD-dependent oxidoreductase